MSCYNIYKYLVKKESIVIYFRYASISISYSLLCGETIYNNSCIPFASYFCVFQFASCFHSLSLTLSLSLSFSLFLSLSYSLLSLCISYFFLFSVSIFHFLSLSLSLLSLFLSDISNGRFHFC